MFGVVSSIETSAVEYNVFPKNLFPFFWDYHHCKLLLFLFPLQNLAKSRSDFFVRILQSLQFPQSYQSTIMTLFTIGSRPWMYRKPLFSRPIVETNGEEKPLKNSFHDVESDEQNIDDNQNITNPPNCQSLWRPAVRHMFGILALCSITALAILLTIQLQNSGCRLVAGSIPQGQFLNPNNNTDTQCEH